jgi:Tfp pilus assembly protein PilO
MANWTQKKLLLTICGSSFAMCMLAGVGIYYTEGLIEEVEAKVADQEKAIEAADAKIATIPALEKSVIILRENLDEYVKILPNAKELSDFLRMLQTFDRQTGVQSKGLVNRNRLEAKGEQFTPIEYTYDMTATMWQCMKFMNLIENFERFVSITDFSIVSGGTRTTGEDREGDSVHTVKLALQTYRYNGKAGSKEVQIPEYAAQKEALREEIWANMQKIRLDRYAFRGDQGRRDILVDPRERGDVTLNGRSQADQRAVLDRYVGEVARLREIQTKIKKQDTTLFEQYSLEKALKEGLEKLALGIQSDGTQVTYAPYRLRWSKDVVSPYEELRGLVIQRNEPTNRKDPYLGEPELRQLVSDMESDCATGQLEQAKNRYEALGARLNVPADDPRHALAVAAKSCHVKASTALDFKSLDLKVQGVVVNHDGRSGVLLNGETYEEGDYVSDDLLVKKVEEEQIWFVFRGLTLVRTM